LAGLLDKFEKTLILQILIEKPQAPLESAAGLLFITTAPFFESRLIMRKVTLALLAVAGLLMFHQEKAHAAQYPYCLSYTQGWSGMIEDCSYSTMEQCRLSTGGVAGSCAPNWRLQFNSNNNPEPEPVKRTRSRRQS
jgi:Protein of unknown function (DUF3551)